MVISEITGMITGLFAGIMEMNIILIFALVLIFVVLAYKVVKIVMKAVLFGIIGAICPFFLNYIGIMAIPITLTNILSFALLGMLAYIFYAMLSGGVKTLKMVTSPFRSLFRRKEKEKIIIRERMPSEEKKKQQ